MVNGPDAVTASASSTGLDALTVTQLRELRNRLGEEEHRVSYWRRLLQARIDVLTTMSAPDADASELAAALWSGPDLRRALSVSVGGVAAGVSGGVGCGADALQASADGSNGAAPTTARDTTAGCEPEALRPRGRLAHTDARAMDVPRETCHADAAQRMLMLWERVIDPRDAGSVAAVLADLRTAEAELSQERSRLHARLDAATAELIARYRTDPLQALTALPRFW
jgi:hypothetical protein